VKKIRNILLILSFLLGFPGCEVSEIISMRGKLIYSPNDTIYELDLAAREQRNLFEGKLSDNSITAIDASHLLIGTYLAASSIIQEYDIENLTFETVAAGYRPVYMRAHHKFLYSWGDLYLADLERSTKDVRKIAEGEFSYAHVTPVSEDEVVFPIVSDAGHTPPYLYNIVTERLGPLPFSRQCTAYIWRSASKQLLCGVDGTREYFLIGLDGQKSVPVDFSSLPSNTPLPLLYIPEYFVLILNVARVAWGSERWDLWAYSFTEKSGELLVENTAPGRGAIVWVDGK
jgi:hypothetical protein